MKIAVATKSTYTGQKDGKWTEEITGTRFLEKTTTFIHKSHKKISSFEAGVTTCAYNEDFTKKQASALSYDAVKKGFQVIDDRTHIAKSHILPEYVYTIEVPKGTHITDVGINEVRFEMPLNASINLIGEMGEMRVKDNSYNTKVYGGNTIMVFTKKY